MDEKKVTASSKAKSVGLKNLAEVCEMTGQSAQTLNNWFNDKPGLFKVILAGCVQLKTTQNINNFDDG